MNAFPIKKAKKMFLTFLLSFGTILTLTAQVQDSLTINTGNVASAIGFQTEATGDYSFAAGCQSVASGMTTTAIGYHSYAAGTRSIAIGNYNESQGDQSYTFGQGNKTFVSQSLAIGRFMETSASGSIALGSSISGFPMTNGINNSLMIGFNSTVPTFFISESEHTTGFNGHGKVGIGTSDPVARFQVSDGDIFIEDIDRGIVMKSPDGNCWRGTLNNDGLLVFVKLSDCISLNLNENTVQQGTSPFKIFPNPASNLINIECSETEIDKNYTIGLFDTTGRKMLSITLTAPLTNLSVNGISPGQYVLTISNTKDSYSEVVIIN